MCVKKSYCVVFICSLLMSGCVNDIISKNSKNLAARTSDIQLNYQKINDLLLKAEEAIKSKKISDAQDYYLQVLNIEPSNERAQNGLLSIEVENRHQAMLDEASELIGNEETGKARLKLKSILVENPKNQEAIALIKSLDLKQFRDQLTPKKLGSDFNKSVTLEFKDAGLQNIFNVITRTTGINFIFDPTIKSDLKSSIFVKDATVDDVIDFLLLMHQLSKKVLTENSILIYPNARSSQYEDMILKNFYLTHADAKQTMQLIKQMLSIKEVFVDEKLNMISLKATYSQIRDAEKLIAGEDLPDPEVVLDVEVLEVKRSRLTEIGATIPSSVSILSASDKGITWNELVNANRSSFNLSPIPSINLLRQDGDTNLLANPRIRVKSREKAKIHIGDKIPIESTTTSTGTGAFIGKSASYLDVGLKLEVEPKVMLNNDVSIKLSLEVSNASLPAGATYPTVNTRNTETALMTGDGETQVLAGLINDEDRKNGNKVAGLSDLPIVGRLFTNVNRNQSKTEIVLLITPHVVRNLMMPDAANIEFYNGIGGRTEPVNFSSKATLKHSASGNQPRSVKEPDDSSQDGKNDNLPLTVPPSIPIPVLKQ